MYLLVSNAFVTLDECHKSICMLTWHLYRRIVHFINLFIIKVYCFIFISLIFNNYVMEDYACFHDLLEHFRIEKSCRSINNCKSCLEYSKCTLNILHISFLGFCKYIYIYIFVLMELGLFLQILTTLDICHHQQSSISLCSHYRWLSNLLAKRVPKLAQKI